MRLPTSEHGENEDDCQIVKIEHSKPQEEPAPEDKREPQPQPEEKP